MPSLTGSGPLALGTYLPHDPRLPVFQPVHVLTQGQALKKKKSVSVSSLSFCALQGLRHTTGAQ